MKTSRWYGVRLRGFQARLDVTAVEAQCRLSERRAWGLLDVAVSSGRHPARGRECAEAPPGQLRQLALEHPRFDSPRRCVQLRREEECNHKRDKKGELSAAKLASLMKETLCKK